MRPTGPPALPPLSLQPSPHLPCSPSPTLPAARVCSRSISSSSPTLWNMQSMQLVNGMEGPGPQAGERELGRCPGSTETLLITRPVLHAGPGWYSGLQASWACRVLLPQPRFHCPSARPPPQSLWSVSVRKPMSPAQPPGVLFGPAVSQAQIL